MARGRQAGGSVCSSRRPGLPWASGGRAGHPVACLVDWVCFCAVRVAGAGDGVRPRSGPGHLGGWGVLAAASVGPCPLPPVRLEAFLGAPLGRVRVVRAGPFGQWLLQVLKPPPQCLRDGVRRGRFGLGRSGWGSANSLAMRDVTVVPVLSGYSRRHVLTRRDKPVCLGPARVSGPRQGVAWRPGGLHGRCGGGPLQPVGFAK